MCAWLQVAYKSWRGWGGGEREVKDRYTKEVGIRVATVRGQLPGVREGARLKEFEDKVTLLFCTNLSFHTCAQFLTFPQGQIRPRSPTKTSFFFCKYGLLGPLPSERYKKRRLSSW